VSLAALIAACAATTPVVARAGVGQPTFDEASPVAEDDPFEGRVIRRLVIRTREGIADDGTPIYGELDPVPRQRAINAIRSYTGAPYRPETARADVDRLSRLVTFGRVESAVVPLDDGSIELIFTLAEQPIIQDIQVTGNRALTDQRLAQEVGGVLVGAPVERFQIDRAARRIEDLYRERGYYRAEVTVDEDELAENGIVLFRIREGPRVRVTDIRFEGALSFQNRELRREIETRKAGIFRRGAVDEDILATDVGALVSFYRDRGYLDVRADRVVRTSADGREAIIIFLVDEGPRYTFRSLKVVFEPDVDPVFNDEQLLGLMTVRPGDVYGAQDIIDSVQAIRSAYGQMGYTDAQVIANPLRDPDRPQVDLRLRIDPGRRYKTGEVIIAGNDITKQNVIRRHVEVLPGATLSSVSIERTENRLESLRLFDPLNRDRGVRITLQPPDPAEPEYRDVLIEVEETNTGDISFGGLVSSDSGLVGRVAITQRNFDITDVPDSPGEFFAGRAFRGGGQTLTLQALPGNEVQEYSIGLSEPYLLETDYSGSVNARFRDRNFDEYDQQNLGGSLGLGRRFGTRWNGATSFRIDRVSLTDIPDDAPVDVFAVENANLIMGIGAQLSRRSLDRFFLPNRGSATTVGVEQVIGDFEFTKLSARHEVYVPLRGDFLGRATVVSLATRVDYIPQDRDDVPVYERYYQGGQSFRGFDFRTISPKGVRNDTGEVGQDPVGGTWSFYTGLELRQPLVEESVHIVGFIDTGTVTFEPGFEDYRVSVGVGLRLSVPALSPAPLAFDFGFPLVEEEGDEGRLFSFSVDLPF
jgi:outer membrane protein insertion porin family